MIKWSMNELVQNCFGNSYKHMLFLILMGFGLSFFGCSTEDGFEGSYDYEFQFDEGPTFGVLKLNNENGAYTGILNSFEIGTIELENLQIADSVLTAEFEKWGEDIFIKSNIQQ